MTLFNWIFLNFFLFIGEVFNQDELAEMFSAAADPETGNILYKDFVPQMVVEDSLY